MKSAVMRFEGIEGYCILLPNHTVIKATTPILREFLTNFKQVETSEVFLSQETIGAWEDDDPAIRRGDNYAYITDDDALVIYDFSPFASAVATKTIPVKMLTTAEFASLHKKSEEQVKYYCQNKRLAGAQKFGKRAWAIPETAKWPDDNRYSVTVDIKTPNMPRKTQLKKAIRNTAD